MHRITSLVAAAVLLLIPAAAWSADSAVTVVTRAVEAIAPGAVPVPGGFRFTVEDVAVSVLTDEAAGLLRVVARAGDLGDREVGLVASALSPDMLPDLGARLVSVRGLMCAAVLAPLRGLTDGLLRGALDGAVRMARQAAAVPPDPPADTPLGSVPAGLPVPTNLPVHASPTSR
jgi:hypothetical protein